MRTRQETDGCTYHTCPLRLTWQIMIKKRYHHSPTHNKNSEEHLSTYACEPKKGIPMAFLSDANRIFYVRNLFTKKTPRASPQKAENHLNHLLGV